jgi:hypothetical protein
MLSKNQLMNLFRQETATCKHLHSKLDREKLDFRLGENMRSPIELMRYLACCARVPAKAMLTGDWSAVRPAIKEMDTMNAESFPAALDRQMQALEEMLGGLSEGEFDTRIVKTPFAPEATLGEGLISTSVRFTAAYRMQFYLHLKASGRSELVTRNCWAGLDPVK